MRPRHLLVAAVAAGAIGASMPAKADSRGVFVPMNHGISGRAYPPVWATPSGRTCQRVSTPSDGWICVAGPPSLRLGRYGDPSFDRSETGAKQAKAKSGAYAAKPKVSKKSAKTVKRTTPGKG